MRSLLRHQCPIRTTTALSCNRHVVETVENVTITPYLSRDTTYCYRHCKGISRFPLLLHHPSPRPMPDRTTSTSLTFAYVTTPYRTHASNPHHVYRLTDSLVPLISLPHFPLDVIMTYDSDPDSDLILPMTSLLTDPLR